MAFIEKICRFFTRLSQMEVHLQWLDLLYREIFTMEKDVLKN